MHKITYLVNGDTTTNTIHCKILTETKTLFDVLINDELERKIKKRSILSLKSVYKKLPICKKNVLVSGTYSMSSPG